MAEHSFKSRLAVAGAFIKKLAKKVWAYLKVAKMEWLVMLGLLALDLISKQIVQATMSEWQSVTLIPKFLNIHYVYNKNAAFGADFLVKAFGRTGARVLFSVFAIAASVVFGILLVRGKNGSKLYRVSLAMLIAGALGNCVDRMFLGFVRDFIEFVYFGFTWFGRQSFYVFNFADSELVIGVILFVIYFIFVYKDKHDEKKEAKAAAAAESAEGAAENADALPDVAVSETAAESADNIADGSAGVEGAEITNDTENKNNAENAESTDTLDIENAENAEPDGHSGGGYERVVDLPSDTDDGINADGGSGGSDCK